MKNPLTIIFIIVFLNCLGQVQSQQLIEQTATKAGIQKSDVFYRLATSQIFNDETLIVIPEIAEDGDGYMVFNSNIILVDNESGTIKAKFRGEKDLYIDAVSIDMIEIEAKKYHLNEKTAAFGLRIFYSNQSRPNPYSGTELSLYVLRGNQLRRILKDFSIKTFNGKTDTTCNGEFEEHSKDIQILDSYTNDFADLKFIDEIELFERNEDCEKVVIKTRKETEILKYENDGYKKVLREYKCKD